MPDRPCNHRYMGEGCKWPECRGEAHLEEVASLHVEVPMIGASVLPEKPEKIICSKCGGQWEPVTAKYHQACPGCSEPWGGGENGSAV